MRSQLVANGTLAFRTAVFRRPQQSCRTLLLLLLLDEKWLERALLACGLAISFSCLCLCRRRQGDNKSYIVCLPEAAKWEGGKEGRRTFQATDRLLLRRLRRRGLFKIALRARAAGGRRRKCVATNGLISRLAKGTERSTTLFFLNLVQFLAPNHMQVKAYTDKIDDRYSAVWAVSRS